MKFLINFFLFLIFFNSTYAFKTNFQDLGELEGQEDDKKTYKIIESTPYGTLNLELHFEKIYLPLVKRFDQIIRTDILKVINYFQYAPKDTIHVVIDDNDTYSANGSATVFPYSNVILQDFAPTGKQHLSYNGDWLSVLVIHELTHIIHLDQTKGFLSFLEAIFGNLGKLGGVVPRWFTEGLAVWAETEFSYRGRNRAPLLKRELEEAFFDPEFCKSIDCFDDPGDYPYSQFPYWIGGYFLSHLEKNKPGTIRCLLTANSDNIPFFVNFSFQECTGKTAQELFTEFRTQFLTKKEISQIEDFSIRPLSSDWKTSWQRDFQLIKNNLLIVQYKNFTPFLNSYDLEKDSFESFPVENLVHTLFTPTPYDKRVNELAINFASPSVEDQRNDTFYFSKDLKSLTPEEFGKKTDYIFRIDKNRAWALNYSHMKWFLYDLQGERKNLIWTSRPQETISQPLWIEDLDEEHIGLILKAFDPSRSPEQRYFLAFIPDGTAPLKLKTLYTSSRPFTLHQLGESHFIIEDSNFKIVSLTKSGPKFYDVSKKFPKSLLEIRSNAHQTVLLTKNLPGQIYISKHGPSHFLKKWRGNEIKQKISKKVIIEAPSPEKEIEAYPSFRHFLPHYWKLSYDYGVWGAKTTVNDPFMKHNFSFLETYEHNSFFPDYLYRYRKGDSEFIINYLEYLNFNYTNRLYERSKNFLSDLQFLSRFYKTYLKYGLSVSSMTSETSTIPERSYRGGLSLTFGKREDLRSVFFKFFKFSNVFYYYLPEFQEKFWGARTHLSFLFNLTPKLFLYGESEYSYLDKSSFKGGTFSGGGYSSKDFTHNFRAISKGAIGGNRIFSSNFEFDYRLTETYRGIGFIPIFLRETHLLFGYEYIWTDGEMNFNNKIYTSSKTGAHSIFSQIDFNSTLFYGVSANFSYFAAYLFPPENGNPYIFFGTMFSADMTF